MKKIKYLVGLLFSISLSQACYSQNIELKEGDKAPNFTLVSDEGKSVSLSDYKSKSNVVLYFYPKDNTSGCTKEACNFRDNIDKITEAGAVVIGISIDDVASHKDFKEKQKLNYLLLADTAKTVSKMYSGLNPVGMSKRVTFVIDKQGVIRKVYAKVDVNEHYKEIIAELKELK